jgi:hypothetical protein
MAVVKRNPFNQNGGGRGVSSTVLFSMISGFILVFVAFTHHPLLLQQATSMSPVDLKIDDVTNNVPVEQDNGKKTVATLPEPSFKSTAGTTTGGRLGPFKMPIRGKNHYISQPLYDMDSTASKDPQLIASPETFVSTFEKYLNWVNPMVQNADEVTNKMTSKEHALFAYLEMMKSLLSATAYNAAELGVQTALGRKKLHAGKMSTNARQGGVDWTYMGATMTGWKRLDNIRNLLQDVIKNDVKGDYIETGVWRGGASVFARAVISAYGETEKRVSYVCDSFAGLPPGDKKLDAGDANWDNTPYLEVPIEIVTNNFIKYGMLDSNVVFAKGFFNETMPPLKKEIKTLAVMRLDVSTLTI